MNKKNLKRIITPLFLALIILFFVFYLRDVDFSTITNIDISIPLLLIATVLSLSFRYLGVFIWRFILKKLGAKDLPKFNILANVYAKSWMGRYIPGTVTWIAGKIYFASQHGISKGRLGVSSLLEAGIQISATMSLSLLILGFDPRLDVFSVEIKLLLVVIGLSSLMLLWPPIFNRLLKLAYKILKRKQPSEEIHVKASLVLKSFGFYLIGSLVAGVSYYFLTASIYPEISPEAMLFIIGAFNLSSALGMATPFVPSGLGVRDGMQLVLLSVIMPKEIALAVTIFSRLWSALVDVIFYLVAAGYHNIKKLAK